MKAAFILVIVLFSSAVALSNTLERIPSLIIKWDTENSQNRYNSKIMRRKSKQFVQTCKMLGIAMATGHGSFGLIPFRGFSCFVGQKKVFGRVNASTFELQVLDQRKQMEFRILFKPEPNAPAYELAYRDLPRYRYNFRLFTDPEFVDLFALSLADQLPFAGVVHKKQMNKRRLVFKFPRSSKAKFYKYASPMSGHKELMVYRPEWDPSAKRFGVGALGKLSLKKSVQPAVSKNPKSRGGLTRGRLVYVADEEATKLIDSGFAMIHSGTGVDRLRETFDSVLTDASEKLRAAIRQKVLADFLKGENLDPRNSVLDTLLSGYIGFRYGRQIFKGSPLIEKTSVFSLLVELRGGPLEGLRYYYDKLPKTVAKEQISTGAKEETSIEWSRHVLGMSFDIPIEFLFVDRMTLDPKIGMWNFEAKLSNAGADTTTAATSNATVTEFKLGNTLSTALEVGIENVGRWYVLRGWYSFDIGVSLGKSDGKVSSNRFGIDGYWTAGPEFSLFGADVQTGLLGFYVYESVSLTGGGDGTPGSLAAYGYKAGYAGMGGLITW